MSGVRPDDGDMDERRAASLVMVAGGVGLVVGRALFAHRFGDGLWTIWAGYFWLNVGVSLILLGLAIWHFRRFGIGKLAAIGVFAVVALLFTLNDFFDGDVVRFRSDSVVVSIRIWLVIGSTAVVLVGVLWSAGQQLADVPAPAWWRTRWFVSVVGVAVFAIIGSVGFVVFGDKEKGGPANDVADEVDRGLIDDEWSITSDGDLAGSYIFSMIKTFTSMDEADMDDLGGRLVWPETEIDLCDVNVYSAGDAFVQIGIVSPTTEGCPGMLPAFVDFGLPETACLFVRAGGIDDEFCSPLDLN